MLISPADQAQFSITGIAQGQYGALHAGISSTLGVSGVPMQARSEAQAGFSDVITISYPPLDGQPGLLYVSYRLSGSASASGANTSFLLKISAEAPLEHRFSLRASSATWGSFTLPRPIRFTYGVPFGLEFTLLATNTFPQRGGARSSAGSGSASSVNGLLLTGLKTADQSGNPVKDAFFSSMSGTQYGPNGLVPGFGASATNQPPFVSSLRPSSGPPGTSILVTGGGFVPTAGGVMGTPGGGGDYGGNTVQLGSDVQLRNLNSTDGTTLQFEIPPKIATGTYSLTVANTNGASNTVKLTVTGN
jgi:hypothetical protein